MLRCRSRRRNRSFRRAPVAEHPFEHHLRVDLHRERPGRRLPRDGVGVGAAVALAAVARVGARILDRELQRRQQRVLADPPRDALVDGGPGVDVRAGRLLRLLGAEIRGRDEVVGAGHPRRRLRRPRPEPARDHHLVPERLERLPDVRIREAPPHRVGNPVAGRGAVRDEDPREAGRRRRGGVQRRGRRHHRLEQRQRDRRAHSPQKRPARQAPLRDEHPQPPPARAASP